MVADRPSGQARFPRRAFLVGAAALSATVAAAYAARDKLRARVSRWTLVDEFTQTPALVPHDPTRDATRIATARGGTPAQNVDDVLAKLGGMARVVGPDDLVLIKVSAQWWNQGMTNVAAVKRVIEHVLGVRGFRGEVVVFENTHFRLANGSGLSRAFTRASERNVDVEGFRSLGDLVTHFESRAKEDGAKVGFVGLVDAGLSALSDETWHDPGHEHGVYGGDGRGPIAPGEVRDGYVWDFAQTFRVRRSLVEWAATPLTWPVFFAPRSGTLVDFKEGAFRVEAGRRTPTGQRVRFLNLTTANEHASTGYTGCCKSAMGIVDMSAGRLGTDPRVRAYRSVHYIGNPEATWRMAGPLASFAREVRAPDLYITVAEWVGAVPSGVAWNEDERDLRLDREAAHRTNTVVAGVDPVAIDAHCIRELLMPLGGARRKLYDLDDESSKATAFLREFRRVAGRGTLDPTLVDVA